MPSQRVALQIENDALLNLCDCISVTNKLSEEFEDKIHLKIFNLEIHFLIFPDASKRSRKFQSTALPFAHVRQMLQGGAVLSIHFWYLCLRRRNSGGLSP